MVEQQMVTGASLPDAVVLTERQVREKELEQRYARKITPHADLTFEFTRDPALLHQYYLLRQRVYTEQWGLRNFSAEPDAFDRRGMILVVRKGRLVVAGIRMVIRMPRSRKPLQIETDGIDLRKELPELHLERTPYCEFSRFACLPEYRGADMFVRIYRALKRKAIAHRLRYGFVLAPHSQIRNYRMMSRFEGEEYIIREDVPVPDHEDFEGIRMVLSYFSYLGFEGEDEYGREVTAELPVEG